MERLEFLIVSYITITLTSLHDMFNWQLSSSSLPQMEVGKNPCTYPYCFSLALRWSIKYVGNLCTRNIEFVFRPLLKGWRCQGKKWGSHIVFRDFTSNLGAYMNDPSVIWSFCFCFSHHFGNRLHIPLSSYICTLGLDCMIAVFRAQIIFHFLHVEMSKIIGEVCVSKSVEIWMEVVRLIWVIVGNHKKFESDEK